MDLGVRNELPKMGQDTRYLLDYQRQKRDGIQKECDEYETRIIYLKDKIKEIEDRLFNTQMGEKIKELVKENLSLSIDAQCLSIVLDICNQGMERGVPENNPYRNSPGRPPAVSPNHPMGGGSPMGGMNRANTPTSSNVVTLDTTSYPYARVISPNMPYPVQPGLPTLPYPMTGQQQLAPHPLDTARQLSMGPHHVSHPNFYNYSRQGSVNILNQVPPPGGWMHPQNFPMSPTPNPAPPVLPPRPTELNIPNLNLPRRNPPTPPNRPVPPPPTPPKPTRSPNFERPRSSNDLIDQREDDNIVWKCSKCTFDNHGAINSCEICGNPRGPNVGTIGPHNTRSPN